MPDDERQKSAMPMLKRLSNFGEQTLHDEIVAAAGQYRASIYRKVRIADVIDISKLPNRAIGTYALQAHFDFCVCDENYEPAFAIEYDGGGHDPKNDAQKNALAQGAGLALFRVDERLLNRSGGGLTFLQYLVHTYFLGEAFLTMQENGKMDPSEPFMMSGFLKRDAKHIFDSDFDFSGPARGRLNRIARRYELQDGPLAHLRISGALFATDNSRFVGYAGFPIGDRSVYGRGELVIGPPSLGRLGELPFGWSALGDYCEGMMLEDLCDELEIYLNGGGHTSRSKHDVIAEIAELKRTGFDALRGFGGPDASLMSLAFPKKDDE